MLNSMYVFIEPEWLKFIKGKCFYYPSAGTDFYDAIYLFREFVSTFFFCDLNYPRGLNPPAIGLNDTNAKIIHREKRGDVDATFELKRDDRGKSYRSLEPSWLIETYVDRSGREIRIVRRRGYGQMGIDDFQKGEIGVFMHRGDSSGEAGSGIKYLANRRQSYPPCSNLFDQLAEKLSDRSIIISDGSNSDISFLIKYHRGGLQGDVIYEEISDQEFWQYGFTWRCIGWLTPRYGPTLIWGLIRGGPLLSGGITRPSGAY